MPPVYLMAEFSPLLQSDTWGWNDNGELTQQTRRNMPYYGNRRCPQCRQTFPLDPQHFYVRPGNGVAEYCQGEGTNDCHDRYWAERARIRRERARTTPGARARASAPADPSQLRFGVELEFVGNCSVVTAACVAAGLNAEDREYTHEVTSYWKVVTDGSVCDGGELVSPPLQGEEGFRQVMTACRALQAAEGVTIDQRCGLHVHLEMRGYTARQLGRVWRTWYNNQGVASGLLAPSRRDGQWCYDIPDADVRVVEGLRGISREHTRGTMGYMERYRNLNGTCYPRYGTIEFRGHQGTRSGKKTVAWIKFLRALVRWAAEGDVARDAQEDLHVLVGELGAHGLDDETAAYLLGRAAELQEATSLREERRAGRRAERQASASRAGVTAPDVPDPPTRRSVWEYGVVAPA